MVWKRQFYGAVTLWKALPSIFRAGWFYIRKCNCWMFTRVRQYASCKVQHYCRISSSASLSSSWRVTNSSTDARFKNSNASKQSLYASGSTMRWRNNTFVSENSTTIFFDHKVSGHIITKSADTRTKLLLTLLHLESNTLVLTCFWNAHYHAYSSLFLERTYIESACLNCEQEFSCLLIPKAPQSSTSRIGKKHTYHWEIRRSFYCRM